jgi:uncharacterized protein
MSAAFGLFRLQQVDSRINQMETRRRKIQETLDNDSELQAALQKLSTAEQEEHQIEQSRRAAEEGAREQQIKIQQAESSLYGGKGQSPKELQDLQADVASLKKRLMFMEEQELEAMVKLESIQVAVQAAREELNGIRSRLNEANVHLLDERDVLTKDLASLESERQAALSSVDSKSLKAYDALRQERRGVAVAEISDNACGACGTTLTAALQQSARHAADLMHCPTCGRILFAP